MDKLIDPILARVLKETKKNPMSVGGPGSQAPKYCFYQPHNYRLYFDFDKATFKLPSDNGTDPYPRFVNSKELCWDNFHDCRIVLKKTQIEITNKINPRWYLLQIGTEPAIKPQFEAIIAQKDKECKEVLKVFLAIYGGSSAFHILNSHSEDKIMGEESIDKIPLNMVFHSDLVKKVYKESNVEFSGPGPACNYLRNRAIESVSPEIMASINALAEQALNPLTAQIKLHLKVQRATLKYLKAITPRPNKIKSLKEAYGW